jgi:hypothetical protein
MKLDSNINNEETCAKMRCRMGDGDEHLCEAGAYTRSHFCST